MKICQVIGHKKGKLLDTYHKDKDGVHYTQCHVCTRCNKLIGDYSMILELLLYMLFLALIGWGLCEFIPEVLTRYENRYK